MRIALCLTTALALAACATGVPPHDGLTWYRDNPTYRFKALEWNHLTGGDLQERMQNLCGDTKRLRWDHYACTVRIRESGLCVVFSIYSEAQARVEETPERTTVYDHELAHCGRGMPLPGGWAHVETVWRSF